VLLASQADGETEVDAAEGAGWAETAVPPLVNNLTASSIAASEVTAVPLFISLNGEDFARVQMPTTLGATETTAAEAAQEAFGFIYYPLPTLTDIIPTGGPAHPPAGSIITVIGSGFSALHGSSQEAVFQAGLRTRWTARRCPRSSRSSPS